MLKIGDKLHCIKDYKNKLTKNKTYTIIGVYNTISYHDSFIILSDTGNFLHISIDDYFLDSTKFDYFITIKELRKQKIEKLKYVNR